MHDSKFSSMQEAYDNTEAPFDEGLQTQEEIDKENDQEFKYNNLVSCASGMDYEATQAFIDFIKEIERGNQEDAEDLLMNMIERAADYNGSEATVPDFVRLVRMAFEWKSKQ